MNKTTKCLEWLQICVTLGFVFSPLSPLSGSAFAAGSKIYIGTSETSITPDDPVALEGAFALRISDGIESPIMACMVVLESRKGEEALERSVMVSADLVHLPMEMVHAVRRRVAEQIPELDVSKLFISTTHTHQAPVVMRRNFIIPDGVMTVGQYIEFFVDRVAKAIVKAHGNLEEGSVAWGLGHAQVAHNRRIGNRHVRVGPGAAAQRNQARASQRDAPAARLEGTNNKIKTMKRQAYGFRDPEFLMLKILGLHETTYALVG